MPFYLPIPWSWVAPIPTAREQTSPRLRLNQAKRCADCSVPHEVKREMKLSDRRPVPCLYPFPGSFFGERLFSFAFARRPRSMRLDSRDFALSSSARREVARLPPIPARGGQARCHKSGTEIREGNKNTRFSLLPCRTLRREFTTGCLQLLLNWKLVFDIIPAFCGRQSHKTSRISVHIPAEDRWILFAGPDCTVTECSCCFPLR